ncbi:hypothetical protein [Desulfovibrio psychrotolerans]|uniref:Response regulatory domain-containing protein n=1 Tax=Desulfovibrio psychrotolerans TaxID=415242 RepID=A0A7J0BUM8_9BACT|nr:hypothetical protein [Desulfovibrio psychrotolerans]GFM36875.1 hypothetical protein DSM19430T_15590 [Desulfovibrio psychrotolerans]
MVRYENIDRAQCTILIAERNSRIGMLLEKAFANRGYPVRVAATGYEAAEILMSEKPALVVLDPDLPYLFALLEAGKGILSESVPVILHPLSASEEPPFGIPPARTVCKEADPEQLLSTVENTLYGHAAREVQR